MKKGDIVLIVLPFTDLSGSKLRPAIVMAETPTDVTAVFITTQLKWAEATDVLLHPSEQNGVKKPSLIRISKIATLEKSLVKGKIGVVDADVLKEMNVKLKSYLQLS